MPDYVYWGRAAASLLRHVRTAGFARNLLTAGLTADAAPKAATIDFLAAYPEAEGLPVSMDDVEFRRSNMDPLEQYILAALVTINSPRRIFEIGTYDGATTLMLARAAPRAEVFTLDLQPESADAADVFEEATNAAASGVGSRFAGREEAARITRLFGDSLTFDYTPWRGSIDLVLVDAGHSYENARADTMTALSLLSPGGIVVWDDYMPGWPGVVRAVDELPQRAQIRRPEGTALAILDRTRFGGSA